LSCDYVLKFDWYCQLSGSGSNSLNSRKLPGRFFYGLGTRLVCLLLLFVYLGLHWRQRVCFDLCLVTTVQLLTSASELRAHCADLEWVSLGNGSPTKPVTERGNIQQLRSYCLETAVWPEKLPCCTVSWIQLGLARTSSTLVIQQQISL